MIVREERSFICLFFALWEMKSIVTMKIRIFRIEIRL